MQETQETWLEILWVGWEVLSPWLPLLVSAGTSAGLAGLWRPQLGQLGPVCVQPLIPQQVWSWPHGGRVSESSKKGQSSMDRHHSSLCFCHLRSLPLGQSKSRGRAWSQWGDTQSYSTQDHGYKERENLWPLFAVCCSANQTVLCTLYKEDGLEPTGTQSFSGIQFKKKKSELCWKAWKVLKTGNLKLAIDKE